MTQRRLEHWTHFSCGGQLSEDILKAGCIYFKRIEDGAAGTIARKKSRLARRSGCEAKGEAKEVTALITLLDKVSPPPYLIEANSIQFSA